MCTNIIGLTHGSRLQAHVREWGKLIVRELTFNGATPQGAGGKDDAARKVLLCGQV